MAPRMCRSTNGSSLAEPQVWFRIVHIAADGHNRVFGNAVLEQTIEIALAPKGTFRNGEVGAVTHCVAVDWVISALLGKAGPLRKPKTPKVVELLRKAIEWQAPLESGEVPNQAEIARREGATRARVTQVMALLRRAPASA